MPTQEKLKNTEQKAIINLSAISKSVINFNWTKLFRKGSKIYFKILDQIDLRIFEREKIAIVGKNGAGKTTLIEIISGFKKPTKGYIEYLFDYTTSPFEKISIQFQNTSFLNRFKVKEIYQLMVKFADEQVDKVEAKKLREILKIDELMDKKFKNLSGGQKQKIALFVSLVYKPKVLILDEYTTGLDIYSKNEIRKYLINYLEHNDVAFVLVTHEPKEIFHLCKKIVVLEKGQIVQIIPDLHAKFKNENALEEFILNLNQAK